MNNYLPTYLSDLIIIDKEKISLQDVFLDTTSTQEIVQLLKEYSHIEELLKYNLPVNNKVLLQGSSGCGKTTTAKAIASALGKDIVILNLSNVICARIGETSKNLKTVFDKAAKDRAVLFLDEFDQLGKERDNDDKDVGEMRRIVNTLIQLIDYYPANALLIAATNHAHTLDGALKRRFQLNISFKLPDESMLENYYDKILSPFPEYLKRFEFKYGVSFAEAKDYAFTQVKALLIEKLEASVNPIEI